MKPLATLRLGAAKGQILEGQAAWMRPVASRDMDVESRLAL